MRIWHCFTGFADQTLHLWFALGQGFHITALICRTLMDSIMSLGGPLKHFTSYLLGKKPKTDKREGTRATRRSSFSRRKSISRRRSLPCTSQKVPDSWLRVYQDELKRERWDFKLIQAGLKSVVWTQVSLVLKETAAGTTGQEECREGSQENSFQEPPLSAEGKTPLSHRSER